MKNDDKTLTPQQAKMVAMLLEAVPEGCDFQLRIGPPPEDWKVVPCYVCGEVDLMKCTCPEDDN